MIRALNYSTKRILFGFTLALFFANVALAEPNTIFGNRLVDSADSGNLTEVVELIRQGYPVDSKGDFGTTPLMRASFRGATDVVKLLLNIGADVNIADLGGATALHMASREGHLDIVKLLLQDEAKIDASDKEGWTSLMKAAQNKKTDVVEELLNANADTQKSNKWGKKAINYAIISDNPEMVRLFTENVRMMAYSPKDKEHIMEQAKKTHNNEIERIVGIAIHPEIYAPKPVIAPHTTAGNHPQVHDGDEFDLAKVMDNITRSFTESWGEESPPPYHADIEERPIAPVHKEEKRNTEITSYDDGQINHSYNAPSNIDPYDQNEYMSDHRDGDFFDGFLSWMRDYQPEQDQTLDETEQVAFNQMDNQTDYKSEFEQTVNQPYVFDGSVPSFSSIYGSNTDNVIKERDLDSGGIKEVPDRPVSENMSVSDLIEHSKKSEPKKVQMPEEMMVAKAESKDTHHAHSMDTTLNDKDIQIAEAVKVPVSKEQYKEEKLPVYNKRSLKVVNLCQKHVMASLADITSTDVVKAINVKISKEDKPLLVKTVKYSFSKTEFHPSYNNTRLLCENLMNREGDFIVKGVVANLE